MGAGDLGTEAISSGSWTPGPLIFPSVEESNSRQIKKFDKRLVTEAELLLAL